jgi:hypothetical protein
MDFDVLGNTPAFPNKEDSQLNCYSDDQSLLDESLLNS